MNYSFVVWERTKFNSETAGGQLGRGSRSQLMCNARVGWGGEKTSDLGGRDNRGKSDQTEGEKR